MKLSVDDCKQTLDIIGDSGGQEAAIVAQFVLDLQSRHDSVGTTSVRTPTRRDGSFICKSHTTELRRIWRAARFIEAGVRKQKIP